MAPTATTPSAVATTPPPSLNPAPGAPGASAALEQPPVPPLPPPAAPAPGYAPTAASAFNPAIGVVLNGHFGSLQPKPEQLFHSGIPARERHEPRHAGLLDQRVRGQFSSQHRPLFVRQPHSRVRAEQHGFGRRRLHTNDQPPGRLYITRGPILLRDRLSQRAALAYLGFCRSGAALSGLPRYPIRRRRRPAALACADCPVYRAWPRALSRECLSGRGRRQPGDRCAQPLCAYRGRYRREQQLPGWALLAAHQGG